MQLLNLKDQQEIVKVIEWLTETHLKEDTVGDVMRRFRLSPDEYRMCSNLAVPALAQGNMKGRFKAVSKQSRAMRRDIRTLYEAVKDEDGPAADGVRELYRRYCDHTQNAVFACAQDDADR